MTSAPVHSGVPSAASRQPPHNPPMQRTAAASSVAVDRTGAVAVAAADRPYVMRRKLTNFATAVSLMLSVAVVALWVRSRASMDLLSRTTTHGTALDGGSRECFVRSNVGELVFVVQPYEYHRTTPPVPDDDGYTGVRTPEPLRWPSNAAHPESAVSANAVE